jgi:hypothetical protein
LTTGERKIISRSADNTRTISINKIKYALFFLITLIVSDAQKWLAGSVLNMQLRHTIPPGAPFHSFVAAGFLRSLIRSNQAETDIFSDFLVEWFSIT